MTAGETKLAGRERDSPFANLPRKISSAGLFEARPKQIWIAVVLALLLGPIGLSYCTVTGTIVMLVISVILSFWFGQLSFLIVLPICAIWAWRAARESSSAFD